MENVRKLFASRLCAAMEAAGYEAIPSVLEREFNLRYWGKPMTLHGVRRWLRGETLPSGEKVRLLVDWLAVTPEQLGFGALPAPVLEEKRPQWAHQLGYQERDLFEAFMSLPVAQRKMLREVILAFVRAYGDKVTSDPAA